MLHTPRYGTLKGPTLAEAIRKALADQKAASERQILRAKKARMLAYGHKVNARKGRS